MRLTAKAEALRAPLKSLLAGVIELIDPPDVPLNEIRRTLRITMSDYPALLVTAALQEKLQQSAPGLDVVIQPWHGAEAARLQLVQGSADLAISVFPAAQDELHREELLVEHYLIAMRDNHPAAANLTLETWLQYPHVLVSGRGDTRTAFDDDLAGRQLSRRVGLVVPNFQIVPSLLRGSDMIAMLPSRVVAAEDGLVTFPPPIPVGGFALHLAWHNRQASDKALRHVAAIVASLLREV
jgi:DNA-binding transcriptional LysR family regulator